VQGVGTSLKVTIQRSSESRAFSTSSEETAAGAGHEGETERHKHTVKFTCYICSITCTDQQVRLNCTLKRGGVGRSLCLVSCLTSAGLPDSHDEFRSSAAYHGNPASEQHLSGHTVTPHPGVPAAHTQVRDALRTLEV